MIHYYTYIIDVYRHNCNKLNIHLLFLIIILLSKINSWCNLYTCQCIEIMMLNIDTMFTYIVNMHLYTHYQVTAVSNIVVVGGKIITGIGKSSTPPPLTGIFPVTGWSRNSSPVPNNVMQYILDLYNYNNNIYYIIIILLESYN